MFTDIITMRIDVDNQQRIKTGAAFVLEFYKIIMGAFLTVFVPRSCEEGVCTLTQNINDEDSLHRVALGFNAFSFLTFLAFYTVELRRENWCIKYLDIDPEKPNEFLDDEIENYPMIKKEMGDLNLLYKRVTDICLGAQTLNVCVSLADISDRWAGAATLTPLLSYILLVFMKLFSAKTMSKSAVEDERAFSAYLTGPKTYNTIDEDHRHVEANSVTIEEEETGLKSEDVLLENH